MEVERQGAADLVIQDGEIEPQQVNGGANSDSDDPSDTNNNPSPNNKEAGSVIIVDGRITKKAKRRIRRNSGKETNNYTTRDDGSVCVSPRDKNMRKSRAGRGRGLPKKGENDHDDGQPCFTDMISLR